MSKVAGVDTERHAATITKGRPGVLHGARSYLLQDEDGGYGGHVFPPIPYERATLRDRGARQELTQRILRALEPTIRQHADQWYHFVPVWKQ